MVNEVKEIELPLGLKFLRSFEFKKKLGILERLYGEKLKKHGTCWVSTSTNRTWLLELNDVSNRWIVYGKYEGPERIDWVQQHLCDGGVYIDSGANIGQFLLYFLDIQDLDIHAFEPVISNFDMLQKSVDYQDSTNARVTLNPTGLHFENTTLCFQLAGPRSTTSLDWYQADDNERIELPVITLDGYCEDNSIDRIRYWKLDVEGAELNALKGAQSLLSNKAIDAVMVETRPVADEEYRAYMSEFGYYPYTLKGKTMTPAKELVTVLDNIFYFPNGMSS